MKKFVHKFRDYLFLRRNFKGIITFNKNTVIDVHRSAKIIGSKFALHIGAVWTPKDPFPSLLVIRQNGSIQIKKKFRVYTGAKIYINNNATLVLGSGYINHNLNISCFERIEIGENVAISENLTIRDSDNHSIDSSHRPMAMPIKIGNNVWIGMNVTILKGVNIGDGAVIASGSIVTKNVQKKSLVAGVPAKEINENISWK